MKKMTKIFALSMTLMFASFSMAESNLDGYTNVRDLINNDNLIIYSYWGCLDDGYTLNDSLYNPIYYLLPPEGDHVAGTVTLRMSKRVGGPHSLETAYITYTIDIRDDSQGNIYVGKMSVERTTVY